ncbi:MAG: gamma carbonic anhydrase family protein [Pseudomonadota bacterium]
MSRVHTLRSFQGANPTLGERVFVDPTATIIGTVALGDDCSVWPMVVIRGDVNYIQIGQRTNVQDGSVLHVSHAGDHTSPEGFPLVIGDDVTIGHKVLLHGCTIGSRCLIGMGSLIMDGVVVEDEVMIGANTLVTPGKRLVSGHLYMGTPAKQVRPLTEEEIQFLTYSARHYCSLKDKYLAQEK